MQYAIVILDGASGEPVPEFGGKTSFEVSSTPYLDALAQQGTVGLMQNVPPHLESSSNVACMSIVGYDPAKYPIGRGAIEGAALGIDLKPGQVALRLNLCYVEDNIMKGYSTDNISTEDGNALCEKLKAALDDKTFTLYPGTSFRQILVVDGYPELMDLTYECPHDYSGKDISSVFAPQISQQFSQPAIDEPVTSRLQSAADVLTDYILRANKVLAQSKINAQRVDQGLWPANFVWPFWPGMKPDSLQDFETVYGKKASLNSAVDLLDGIALLTGMKIYKFEGVTDGPDNDFESQGRGAIQMLEQGADLVVVHVEAPDTAGHDGRPEEKKASIEASDQEIIARLHEYAQSHDLRIAVMPDHPTPLSTRKHSHEPVPFVLAGPGISHNDAQRLTEKEAEATDLLVDPGHRFLGNMLFDEEATRVEQ